MTRSAGAVPTWSRRAVVLASVVARRVGGSHAPKVSHAGRARSTGAADPPWYCGGMAGPVARSLPSSFDCYSLCALARL
jgi:hypothetical protein